MVKSGAPPPSLAAEAPAAHEADVTVSTFSHSSRDMHVVVEKPAAGFLCTLSMAARVPLPPDRLWTLLVDPTQCMRVFKSLKRVNHRRVISDDGSGNRVVEVDQTGAWRFLCFRGSFTVRMIVEQRRSDRTINFRLARPGFMKDFSGTWQIRHFDNAALDQLVNHHKPSPLHRLQSSLRAVEAQLGLGGGAQDSLVQLQQSLAPAFAPPKPVAKVLQRIAAKQISKIMGDLITEAERLNALEHSGSGSGSASSSKDGKAASSSSAPKAAAPAAAAEAAGGAAGEPKRQQRRGKKRRGSADEQEDGGPVEGLPGDKRALVAHVRPLA